MPVYRPDVGWFLAAVRSALLEPACDVELIVVDDGSPEPVSSMLEPLRDPRLRVLRVAHGGASRARNAGIAEARASWVRFVDADDVYVRGSTAALLALAAGDDRILAYGATAFCDERLRHVWTMRCALEGDALVDCLLGRFTVRPQSLLFSLRALTEAGPWDETLPVCEDWDLVLRVLEHARVRGSRQVATHYRRHKGGLTAHAGSGVAERRLVIARHFDRHPEHRGGPIEDASEGMLHAIAARVHLSRGQLSEALAEGVASLRNAPRSLVEEISRAQPAVRGHARRRLSSADAPIGKR